MQTDFAVFGNPSRFEVAVRWARDSESRDKLPARHGWSMGDIRITIAGQIVTQSTRGKHVGWYLAPLFDWMASNWAALLHEEDFSWPDRTGAPAVLACHKALDRYIALPDDTARKIYRAAQGWYLRHALRSAAEGGLFPDLFIRRISDDIELSWSAQPPLFAPEGFMFAAEPGVARLSVDEVAGPLWEVLSWAASVPPAGQADENWRALAAKIETIPSLTTTVLDRQYVDERILEMVRVSLERIGKLDLIQEDLHGSKPFLTELSPAVAMFGGVSPNLGETDVRFLCELLADRAKDGDSPALSRLVENSPALSVPHQEGYAFAEDLLETLGLPDGDDWVDVRALVSGLGIEVSQEALQTDTIRGVAIAGAKLKPLILVNTTSPYNSTEDGKRFTIAHELCHILHDRTRARRVTHVSGRWVDPGIERRANAFAAYLLMPRKLLVAASFADFENDTGAFVELASRLHVSEIALLEHLYNQNLIDELARERLRSAFRMQ